MTIDDDDVEQMLIKRILVRSGMVGDVIQFRAAEAALEFLQDPSHPHIDVILLDINMPRMNGFEFLESAARNCNLDSVGCIVVMLTTSLDPGDRARANAFGIVKDYIAKPLDFDDLHRIRALLDDRSAAAH
ncbi:response regulator [Cognatishimia sp. F0-27]|nr:response regulator [Cognatishimia sp. F0-27]